MPRSEVWTAMMRSRIPSEAMTSLRIYWSPGACEKIPRTFAHSVPLFNNLFLLPLCVCTGVCPSHTTEKPSISVARAAVEAPSFAVHLPLPASEAVLSSWSLVVICALLRGGSSSQNWNFRVIPARTFSFGLVPARTTHHLSTRI